MDDVERDRRLLERLALRDIHIAHARIRNHIHRTPILSSSTIDALVGAEVHFKCENFQKAGVFKARGAFNAVLSLSDAEATRGVVTSSSGNHGAAISLAAANRGIPAYIAMPRVAVRSKVAAVERYGGRIVWVGSADRVPTSEDYEAATDLIMADTGASAVHPYNDERTIAGQGTCALEFIEDRPDLSVLLAPVGGGGLLAGTALAVKQSGAPARVIGCEPTMADDAQQSFRTGRLVPQLQPRTIADGLRTSLGDQTFAIIRRYVDDIVTVSEESIVRAMRLLWDTLKIVVEPSGAVPLAVLLERRISVAGDRVGVILSGGNVDLDHLPW
jgi:threonine dehydratase